MTMNLIEGQTFFEKYTLLHRISENDVADCWVAMDRNLEEKVFLKIFKSDLSDETVKNLSNRIAKQKILQHSFIVRNFELGKANDRAFVTAAYQANTETYLQQGSFIQQWRMLRQVGKALEFAHSVGFTHGHLHPGNILINDQGDAYLTDFGVARSRANDVYFSPQVIDGQDPTPRDDVYSFGQLIYAAISGKPWHEGLESDLPSELAQLVSMMLHPSSIERPTSLSNIIDKIDGFVSKKEEPQGFKPVADIKDLHKLPREQKTVSINRVLGGFVALLSLAILVFFLLPETKPHVLAKKPAPRPGLTIVTSENPPELAPFEIAQRKKMEAQGEKLATRLLRLQIEVEDIGGQVWAAEQYNKSVSLGIAGDDDYRNQLYKMAFDQYQNGINLLEEILASTEDQIDANHLAGDQALLDGDAKLAIESFTILNSITPFDMDILNKLERAENLEKVQSFMSDGEIFERNGDLNNALDRYSTAYVLDNLWEAAQTAQLRVKKTIVIQAFNNQMSLAFAALKDKKFDEAKRLFDAAQELLPNSEAPKDGLEQITIAATQSTIESHRTASLQGEEAEDWSLVAKEYEAILAIASGTTYATEGLIRAIDRLSVENELNQFIAHADLMVTDDALNEAKAVLLSAFRIKDSGKKLQDQINQLSHLISLARIPINVELRSNSKTDVTVYKIRAFGLISSVTLALYPGTYTFVGKRRGYRDVHKEVTLHGGRPAPSIEISCVERI